MSLLALAYLFHVQAQAQLVTYDFEGTQSTPSQVDGNLSAGSFQRNTGNAVGYSSGNGGGDAISGSGWTGVDSSNDKYWEFTVTANAGVQLDLTQLDFDYRSTPTGPSNWELTINGALSGGGSLQNDSSFQTVNAPLVLTGLDSAVVRISGFGASSSGGTWRMDNVMLDGLAVATVPEPSTWVLLCGGFLYLVRHVRKKRS